MPLPRVALATFLLTVLGAQTPDRQQTRSLEFRLRPEAVEGGVPQAFSFLLVNTTNHDVLVPIPAVACEDPFDGSLLLRLYFRPLRREPVDAGRGCALDSTIWPPIMDRIKEWRVVHSGDALTVDADKEHLFYDGSKPGSYEFWATYSPPSVDPAEQKALDAAGVDFPREKMSTRHLTFSKTQ